MVPLQAQEHLPLSHLTHPLSSPTLTILVITATATATAIIIIGLRNEIGIGNEKRLMRLPLMLLSRV
jgi:hypothetical protein